MTKVIIFTDEDGLLRGFEMTGHSGFGYEGDDIVCAALSALSVNTVNSIETLTEDRPLVEQDEAKVSCIFAEPPGEKSLLLLESFRLGVKGISESYRKHVQVKDRRYK